jgi:hypothetical protein
MLETSYSTIDNCLDFTLDILYHQLKVLNIENMIFDDTIEKTSNSFKLKFVDYDVIIVFDQNKNIIQIKLQEQDIILTTYTSLLIEKSNINLNKKFFSNAFDDLIKNFLIPRLLHTGIYGYGLNSIKLINEKQIVLNYFYKLENNTYSFHDYIHCSIILYSGSNNFKIAKYLLHLSNNKIIYNNETISYLWGQNSYKLLSKFNFDNAITSMLKDTILLTISNKIDNL